MKTSELSGRALDYAVALAEGYKFGKPRRIQVGVVEWHFPLSKPGWTTLGNAPYRPDADRWGNVPRFAEASEGDDIIDRHRISTEWTCGNWAAAVNNSFSGNWPLPDAAISYGATRREAAMRAYVASKLGDEIEIPEELK